MAEIQTTHRRVVLVHCDLQTTRRVLSTANELDLFNGEKIWILLDGLLEPNEKFDTNYFAQHVALPNGMLALQNRHRPIFDSNLLNSVVELMGMAALNSYGGNAAASAATAAQRDARNRNRPFGNVHSSPSASQSRSTHPITTTASSKQSSLPPPLITPGTPFNMASNSGCRITTNYTQSAQIEHRFNILR